MTFLSKASLRITTTSKGNKFYGDTTSIDTISNEYIMDKFDGINHPNNGIEVSFQYCGSTFELKANKYAFNDCSDGMYNVLIGNNEHLFELNIRTDENNNIDCDLGLSVDIYDVMDEDVLLHTIEFKDCIVTIINE